MAAGVRPAFTVPQRAELARLRGLVDVIHTERTHVSHGQSSLKVFWRDGDMVCRRDIYPSGMTSPLMKGNSIDALDR